MTPQDSYDDYLYEHGLSDLSDYLGYSPPRDITMHQEDVEDYDKDWKEYLKKYPKINSLANPVESRRHRRPRKTL
jgi:hypothetical protein